MTSKSFIKLRMHDVLIIKWMVNSERVMLNFDF